MATGIIGDKYKERNKSNINTLNKAEKWVKCRTFSDVTVSVDLKRLEGILVDLFM